MASDRWAVVYKSMMEEYFKAYFVCLSYQIWRRKSKYIQFCWMIQIRKPTFWKCKKGWCASDYILWLVRQQIHNKRCWGKWYEKINLSFSDQDHIMLELKYKQHAKDFNKKGGFIAPKIYRLVNSFLLKGSCIQRLHEHIQMPCTYLYREGGRGLS